jgi:hypothetical protein
LLLETRDIDRKIIGHKFFSVGHRLHS